MGSIRSGRCCNLGDGAGVGREGSPGGYCDGGINLRARGGGTALPRVLPGGWAAGGCKPQGVVQEGDTGLRPALQN